jgi:lysyl-tRNA synthetase class 2
MIAPSPWWTPDVYADRRPFLIIRGRILAAIRSFFLDQGFVEVETAALQVSPGNEAHLHSFATVLTGPDGRSVQRYLHTSPEFSCKKLLSAGEQKFFTVARVFRNREHGALHHPEFTMLEWYRAETPYEVLMDDCVALLQLAVEAAGTSTLHYKGRSANAAVSAARLTVAEAFATHAGIDLMATLGADEGNVEALATMAGDAGMRTASDDSWLDIFSRVIVEKIEPMLGDGRATILYEYPAIQSALARPLDRDRRLAERFELFACGVELANAFGELTDPALQRHRLEVEMDLKAEIYGERLPIDEDFIAALDSMPEASGAALGIDRLVMLASGADHIEQVLWTPVIQPDA